jgi:predicted nucleic acid-binding OB-fold protein
MKEPITVRMEASVRDDLKLMALIEKRNMGEIVEELIRERFAKFQRARKMLPLYDAQVEASNIVEEEIIIVAEGLKSNSATPSAFVSSASISKGESKAKSNKKKRGY